MIDYLTKRHPLYFMPGKLNPKQILDLVQRLIYKLKQSHASDMAKEKLADKT